jgi:pilus assembly protein Flp/PilA
MSEIRSANLHKEGELKMTVLFMQAFATVKSLHSTVLDRARSERGASMVEYALLVGLIAIVAVLAVTFLGQQIEGLFNSAGNTLSGVNSPG